MTRMPRECSHKTLRMTSKRKGTPLLINGSIVLITLRGLELLPSAEPLPEPSSASLESDGSA